MDELVKALGFFDFGSAVQKVVGSAPTADRTNFTEM